MHSISCEWQLQLAGNRMGVEGLSLKATTLALQWYQRDIRKFEGKFHKRGGAGALVPAL